MRSRKRLFLIVGIVGILVLIAAAVSVTKHSQESLPFITLNDGRIFSFAGVTAGKEPLDSLKPTWVNRNIGNPMVKFLPKTGRILRTFRIIKPHFPPAFTAKLKKDDITFWIHTRSKGGSGSGSSSEFSPEGLTVNDVVVEIRDTETGERLHCSGSGSFGASDSLSYSFIHFFGIRNKTEHVTINLRQKNEQGALEESATWEVEIP